MAHAPNPQFQLADRCDQPEIIGNVIKTWLKHARDRKTLVYGVNCAHAQHLQERFIEAGINCEYCDGDTPLFEREDIFERLKAGITQIISSVRTLDTGVDLPCVSCVVDARPTKSRMLYVQAWGRGITASPGKVDCLFLDHAGNVRRLGLVTEISSDCLDDGEAQKSAERQPDKSEDHKQKVCPECYLIQEPRAKECPQCGHKFFTISLVRETDDDLVELGQARLEQQKSRQEHAVLYSGLLYIAEKRGYKSGWVSHNFRKKFGCWPNHVSFTPAAPPSLEVLNWVRSRQIAFAKARARYG